MKKVIFGILILFLFTWSGAIAQNKPDEKHVKNNQADLVNDIYVSYGLGSLYFIVDQNSSNNYSTTGSIIFGYARSLGKVIALGFQGSYTNVSHTSGSSLSSYKYTDNYWSGLANIRFRYYNRPSFCMYSGVAIGIALDAKTEPNSSGEKKYQKYYPAGQFTLLGFRIGRALSFFGEFGIGTNAIVNAGVSYKFGE